MQKIYKSITFFSFVLMLKHVCDVITIKWFVTENLLVQYDHTAYQNCHALAVWFQWILVYVSEICSSAYKEFIIFFSFIHLLNELSRKAALLYCMSDIWSIYFATELYFLSTCQAKQFLVCRLYSLLITHQNLLSDIRWSPCLSRHHFHWGCFPDLVFIPWTKVCTGENNFMAVMFR